MMNVKRNLEEKFPEQLLGIAQTVKTPEYRCQGLLAVASIYINSGRTSEADALLRDVLNLTESTTDDKQKAEILADTGIMYAKLGNTITAHKSMSESIKTAGEIDQSKHINAPTIEPDHRTITLNSIFERCESALKEENITDTLAQICKCYALKSANLINDSWCKIVTLTKMALIYARLGQNADAGEMLSSAVKTARAERYFCILSDSIAPAYLELGQTKKAAKTMFLAFNNTGWPKNKERRFLHLRMFYLFADAGMKDIAINILNKKVGTVYLKELCSRIYSLYKGIAELYIRIGMNKEASALLSEKVSQISASVKEEQLTAPSDLQDIAKYFLKAGSRDEALSALSLAVEISKTGSADSLPENFIHLADSYFFAEEKHTAETLLTLALKALENIEPVERQIRALISAAGVYTNVRQFHKVSEILGRAVKLTEKSMDDRLKSFSIIGLSGVFKAINHIG